VYGSLNIIRVIKSRTCSTHRRDDKCIQYFDWKTWRAETTLKAQA